MSRHRWKEKYYNENGIIMDNNTLAFYSTLGVKTGTGTKDNPFPINKPANGWKYSIWSEGYFNQNIATGSEGNGYYSYGSGIDKTFFSGRLPSYVGHFSRPIALFFATITGEVSTDGFDTILQHCRLKTNNTLKIRQLNHSIIHCGIDWSAQVPSANRAIFTSYNEALYADYVLKNNLVLFESCDITIDSAATLNSYQNNYHGFTNCRFKIGAETDYTALTGTTEAQLRNNFKSRCEAQGFAVPDVTDYNETLPMGRWVFADKCTFDGYILRGSIIDNFQTRRFILLGNTGKVVDTLPIGIGSEPFSFNPNSPKDNGIALNENSIALSDDVLPDQISDNRISSSIGMLKEEGLAKLTLFDVVNNFDSAQGVRVAGDRAFGEPITKVDADTNYLIRSTDESEAIVTYNGVNYSSSLSTRNNIFRGVTDKSTFEKSANAVVYPITDLAQQSVVEMRIVRELPPQIIKNGNLLADFWYFVASDNVNNPTGTIRYKGVDYSFGSSFLVDADDLTFAIGNEVGNNLHLRRCWVENYDPNDKTYIDYAFWQGKQQPQWVKVIPSDLRCLMTNDKMSSEIFAIDQQGEYVTSGHPDFYSLINGDAGFSKQSFPIVGKFMQVRLNVSTYNAV